MTSNRKIPDRQLEWIPPRFPRASWEWRYLAWFNFSPQSPLALPEGVQARSWEGKPIVCLVGVVLSKVKGRFFSKVAEPRAHLFKVSPVTVNGENALWVHSTFGSSPHPQIGAPYHEDPVSFHVQFFPAKPVSQGHIQYASGVPWLECKTMGTAQPPMAGYLENFLLEANTWAWRQGKRIHTRRFVHSPWAMWDCEEPVIHPAARTQLELGDLQLQSAFVVKGSPIFCA